MLRAAVAVVLAERGEGLSVLLVQRAERAGDPWSGHLAFPGGRLDAADAGGAAAACRETAEETGLLLPRTARIGRLSDRLARAHSRPLPMVVSPFVFAYPQDAADWRLNHEVNATHWLPLAFVADAGNRQRMRFRVGPVRLRLPFYPVAGQRLWGLTLMMLDELVRLQQRAV